MPGTSRRSFVRGLATTGLLVIAGDTLSAAPTSEVAAPANSEPAITNVEPTPTTATPSAAPVVTVRAVDSGPTLKWTALPRWRGFNLLERFNRDNPRLNRDFDEWDLDAMSEWGFDFVRVPADYRVWHRDDGSVDETTLRSIEILIERAAARGIHVNLSLHRAPGYFVSEDPVGDFDLFGTGGGAAEAQRQFTAEWAMLSQRFAHFNADRLSFGLINEPPPLPGKHYASVITPAVEAIRSANRDRVIIADGSGYGRVPVPELVALQVAQSARGYDPVKVTTYRAPWVEGSNRWPIPTWPLRLGPPGTLFGHAKSELQQPLVVRGSFASGPASIRIDVVSTEATLVISADGRQVFQHRFRPGPGKGAWKRSTYRPEWDDFEALYDLDYHFELPVNASEVTVEVTRGDWLSFSSLSLGAARIVPDEQPFDMVQRVVNVLPDGAVVVDGGDIVADRASLANDVVRPWTQFSDATSTGVMVGEWGVYNETPHDVTLAFMRDYLAAWKPVSLGWALWNFGGPFGIVDSERADVAYESFRGRSLDRAMLELLREF